MTAELLKPENAALLKDLVAKFGAEGWEKVYEEGVCIPRPLLLG